MVTMFLNRVGSLGLLLIASTLLLGGLAGAAAVHHFDTAASSTVASQQAKDGHKHSQGSKQSKSDLRNKRHQGNRPGGPNSAPGGNSNSQQTD